MYETYHPSSDLSTVKSRFVFYRWMQRATRSGFATSTQREYTTVFDLCGAGARREIDHDAPPQVRFFTKIETMIIILLWQRY